MQFVFILDPLESLNPAKDTSLAIMRAADAAGHALYVMQQHDVFLRGAQAKVHCQRFNFTETAYQVEAEVECLPEDFDAIIMRKDPPFDNEYLYSTYLLEIAVDQGAVVLNNPAAIRSWNEKLSITRFSEFTTPFLVTADQALIRQFLATHHDIVVKPLDGMGGRGIFRLREDDPNIGAILETSTRMGQETVMAQQFLPEIAQGDKRIIVIDGEPIPYALARIPKTGETRGNLAAGGKGVAQLLSAKDREIATSIGKALKKAGHFLVGLDVIGDYLTEVNVTSPTGMVEIANQTQHMALACDPAALFVQYLERYVQAQH